ncbi:hypothetical protein AGDE_10988 [Angomonas deanei]|nr:hypothetical protein AGDE_10988 [Angomonas deanei]|eukprot:EPY26995.1 hypothetical protein AGDE_10988 [Angomonas deanei]
MSFGGAFGSAGSNSNANKAAMDDAIHKSREQAKEFLNKETIEEWEKKFENNNNNNATSASKQESRTRHGLLPATFNVVDKEQEERINNYISKNATWRQNFPMLRSFEYWQLRADYYPYIERGDRNSENFFIRGISVHPRLSDYPMCKHVIRDYFICRDENPVLQLFNTCAPLKEQFCACINEVFVKNHERGDKNLMPTAISFFKRRKKNDLRSC